ncbi:MAG: hypothetical protein HYY93_04045 [Planctomycetes bacterium]|nr:hypothetical protein [Planctomycetota bacterium]
MTDPLWSIPVQYDSPRAMANFVSREGGVHAGDRVVVRVDGRLWVGEATADGEPLTDPELAALYEPVVRRLTEAEVESHSTACRAFTAEVLALCAAEAQRLEVALSPRAVHGDPEGRWLIIDFEATGRVDPGELISSLSTRLDREVELRHVNVADKEALNIRPTCGEERAAQGGCFAGSGG